MSAFSVADFEKRENLEKLQVIIFSHMGKPLLGCFKHLTTGEKKRFNFALNAYIKTFTNDWETQLQTDFNTACTDDIFNHKFKAEHNLAGCLVGTDIEELRL